MHKVESPLLTLASSPPHQRHRKGVRGFGGHELLEQRREAVLGRGVLSREVCEGRDGGLGRGIRGGENEGQDSGLGRGIRGGESEGQDRGLQGKLVCFSTTVAMMVGGELGWGDKRQDLLPPPRPP